MLEVSGLHLMELVYFSEAQAINNLPSQFNLRSNVLKSKSKKEKEKRHCIKQLVYF
jgi:hypothetical protein